MRLRECVLLWLASSVASAQDPPGRTTSDDAVFTFTLQQGWTLHALSEKDPLAVAEKDLTRGLQPVFRPLNQNPAQPPPLSRRTDITPVPPTPPRLRAAPGEERDAPRAPLTTRRPADPLKTEGSLTIRGDGSFTFSFKRIEYVDASQRWWIEFEDQKIRTVELGALAKWSGTRDDWRSRLEVLESSFLEAYLKAVTPQKPEEGRGRVGIVSVPPADLGKRLYVTACLEDQLASLLTARLDGARLTRTQWPAECVKYPPRAILTARALVERVLAQCAGELAPPRVRAAKARSVKDQPWDGQSPPIPAFRWADGGGWFAEHERRYQEGWRKLAALTTQSQTGWGIDETAWRAAVKRELEAYQEGCRVPPLAHAPGPADALLPRILDAGKATYDYKEDLDLREGRVSSSDAEIQGTIKDLWVAFFFSGANQWRESRVRLDTWYKGKVQRK